MQSTQSEASTSVIDKFVQRAGELYSLPGVAMEVLRLTEQPTVDTTALRETIENDPALTIKILRVVNSPIYGLSREVSDLSQALSMLGTKPLKMLVLGFSLPRDLFAGIQAEVLEWYWRQSLIRGLAARELSHHFEDASEDDAFIAGLLQGIGILLMVKDLREPYIEFLHQVVTEGADLVRLEGATMGFDHRVLSSRLLESWDLPQALAQAVAVPADANRVQTLPDSTRPLAQVLWLADSMARMLGDNRPEILVDILAQAEDFGGLDVHVIEAVVSELEDKLPHLADVLSLDIGGHAYTDLLLEAFASLSRLAEEYIREEPDKPAANGHDLQQAMAAMSFPAPSPQSKREVPPTSGLKRSQADGPDPGLIGRLSAAVSSCRRERSPVSLVLIEVDQFDDMILLLGVERTAQQMMLFKGAIHTLSEQPRLCSLDDARCALILADYDRQQSIELLRCIQRGIEAWEHADLPMSFSAGLGTLTFPPKNFPVQNLIDATERCLYVAQASGGNTIKSIDVY